MILVFIVVVAISRIRRRRIALLLPVIAALPRPKNISHEIRNATHRSRSTVKTTGTALVYSPRSPPSLRSLFLLFVALKLCSNQKPITDLL